MSHVFPVVDSVLSTTGLISNVLSGYDIGSAIECRLLNRGLNDTYFISAETGKFVLRVYRKEWRSRSDILFELDAILHLHRKGVPVSVPISRRDGEMISIVAAPEGLRCVVMFTYAHGKDPTYEGDGPCEAYLYGKLAGRIHAATDGFKSMHPRYSMDLEHLLTTPLRALQPFLSHRLKDWEYVVGLSERLRSLVSSLPLEKLETGFCHGDLHGWNAHIDQSFVLTVFDFDCCGLGWRAYDLAVFYWAARIRGKEKERWPSFVRGYTEERQFDDVEMRAIPFFVAVRHFWILGLDIGISRFRGFGWLNDGYFDRALKFFRGWEEEHLSNGSLNPFRLLKK
jgi:Ser/Thr protein kinase RdoA (MazF antagonist)